MGVLTSSLAALYVKSDLDQGARREFGFVCEEIRGKIRDRLRAHEQVLRSGAAFFQVAGGVDRHAWRLFTDLQKVDQQLPGIQGIGFSLKIPRERLSQHVQEIRAEGFPTYQVRPEGEREIYSSIIYLEPFTNRNLRAFGYDMFSEPVRREAMERAQDENTAALSGRVTLVQETEKDVQAGTLMYVPVYRKNVPNETKAQRREALLGWVYSPYRMNDLMQGILGGWDLAGQNRVRLEVFDGAVASPENLLYDSQAAGEGVRPVGSRPSLRQEITAAGRQWTLLFTPAGPQPLAVDYGKVWLVLCGGLSTSLLLSGLFVSVMNTRFQAWQIARRLTEQLRESEERLRLAVDGAQLGIWDWSIAEDQLAWSDICRAFHGVRPDSKLSFAVWEASVHPEDREAATQAVHSSLKGRTEFHHEYRVRWPDGTERWIAALGRVYYGSDGASAGMRGVVSDITVRKAAEQALRDLNTNLERKVEIRTAELVEAQGRAELALAQMEKSEFRYRSIFEKSPMGVALIDSLTGSIFEINERFTEIAGRSRQETLSLDWMRITHPDDAQEYQEKMRQLNAGSIPGFQMNRRLLRPNGTVVWTSITVVPVTVEAGESRRHLCIVEDVTERRGMEERLRESQKMEGIGHLAGGMAHEFNNILAAMMLSLSLLRMRLSTSDQALLSDLDALVRRAAGLIKQLLAFSRQSVMRREILDLGETVARASGMLQPVLGNRIAFDYSGIQPQLRVSADKALIEEVLINLCYNARDAMPQGGLLTIRLNAELVQVEDPNARVDARPGRHACLTVADTGCGMTEATLKRLFEPFFTTKEVGKGTGLGLSTVRGIVQQHQGWIEVQSALGQGSVFRVYLPLVEESVSTPAVAPRLFAPDSRETILLVEDEPMVRETARSFLASAGYDVLEAADGAEALRLWEKNRDKIGLVYTDMVMPGELSGLELATRLLAVCPTLKVIVTSGYSTELPALSKMAASAILFLSKPCPPENLLKAIREAMHPA